MLAGPDHDGGPPTVTVGRIDRIPDALATLAVRRGRPVLVLVGGAGGMSDAHLETLRKLLADAVVPLLERHGAAVVDGGTDSGVMQVIGRARAAGGYRFPLVGVAAQDTVATGGRVPSNPDAAALEPHHTHFVLVPGSEWGDEAPWLGHVAEAIAEGAAMLTMVVNGGEITFADVSASLKRHRPVLVLAGTGRTADAIAEARAGREADPRAVAIAASALTRVLPVTDRDGVASLLANALPAIG